MPSSRYETLLALFLAFLAPALLQNPAQAAGGAFVVDDTDVGNPGDCKVESSASYASNDPHNDLILVTTPACVVPIFSYAVEMALSLARFRADNHWGTGLTLK